MQTEIITEVGVLLSWLALIPLQIHVTLICYSAEPDTTSKTGLLFKNRYSVLEVVLMLWAHAHCARHSVKTWAAFLTDSIMHALGVSEAIVVETNT